MADQSTRPASLNCARLAERKNHSQSFAVLMRNPARYTVLVYKCVLGILANFENAHTS